MAGDDPKSSSRDQWTSGLAARLPWWYLVAWAVAILAIMVSAPLVRLTHTPPLGSVLEAVFDVLILGSGLALRVRVSRAPLPQSDLGVISSGVVWLALP